MKFFAKAGGAMKHSLLATLLLLIPVGYYFFLHVPSQQDYFTSRNFRVLGEISQQISQRIESFKRTIDNAAIRNRTLVDIERSALSPELKYPAIQNQIESFLKLAKDLALATAPIVTPGAERFDTLINERLEGDSDHKVHLATAPFSSGGTIVIRTQFSRLELGLELERDGFQLHLDYVGLRVDADRTPMYTVELHANAPLAAIVQPLIIPGAFDNVIVAERDGRVIFQTDQSVFLATHLDSIGDAIEARASSFRDVRFSNVAYKLYSQPVRISLPATGSVKQDSNVEWVLLGMVTGERFSSETRAISHTKIASFVFLVLFVLISLPLFKLIYIGAREPLKLTDVLVAAFSLLIGASLLTSVLVTIYAREIDHDKLDLDLQRFATTIETNFRREVAALRTQLLDLGARRQQDAVLQQRKEVANLWSLIPPESAPYPWFDLAFLIDPKGMQKQKVSTDLTVTPLIDVSAREYFQAIRQGREWQMELGDGQAAMFLEPIYSWSTGVNNSVLTIPFQQDTSLAVAAISTRFLSLMSPVVPEGFGFIIVDSDGRVLYHIDENRNLRENFFLECEKDPRLLAAVTSRVQRSMTVKYIGRGHRLFIHPIDNMPWTLVTFSDMRVLRASKLNILTTGTTFFLALLGIYTAILLLLYLLRKNFRSDWLMPNVRLEENYRVLSLLLFTLNGFYYGWIFQQFKSPTWNMLLTLCMPPIVLALVYIMLQKPMQSYRAVQKASSESGKPSIRDGLWRYFRTSPREIQIGILGFIAVLVFLTTLEIKSLFYGIVGLFAGGVVFTFSALKIMNQDKYPDHFGRYILTAVSLFLMLSVVPTLALFKFAYDAETRFYLKRGQLSIAERVEARADRSRRELERKGVFAAAPAKLEQVLGMRTTLQDSALDLYTDFFFNSRVSPAPDMQGPHEALAAKDATEEPPENRQPDFQLQRVSMLDSLLAEIRAASRISRPNSWELFRARSSDGMWVWESGEAGSSRLELMRLRKRDPRGAASVYVTSDLPALQEPGRLFWFGGYVLILVTLFAGLQLLVRKAFTLDIYLPSLLGRAVLRESGVKQNTIYIGQPSSGKSQLMVNLPNAVLADLSQYSDPAAFLKAYEHPEKLKQDSIVIDHFDYKIEDDGWNTAKLQVLERFIFNEKKVVIIVSTIDPIVYLTERLHQAGQDAEANLLLQRWTRVLSSFSKAYHKAEVDLQEEEALAQAVYDDWDPLARVVGEETAQPRIEAKKRQLRAALLEECRESPFLQKIGRDIVDSNMQFFNREELIYEVRYRAEAYYQSIWSMCQKEEKLVLIHLARHGFVNPKNAEIARRLLRKNLIRVDTAFHLVNESFAHFVCSVESDAVVKSWETEGETSWSSIRTPVVTVLIALALFVYVTQQETFNEAIAWVSAFTAGLPALLKFLSLFKPALTGQAKADS